MSSKTLDILVFSAIIRPMNELTERHLTAQEQRWLPVLRQLLRGLRYGTVQIVIQDSKVIQVEKLEKIRLPLET